MFAAKLSFVLHLFHPIPRNFCKENFNKAQG